MLPHEFLELARRLIDHDKTSAGFRTAASRAYYGAYHTALTFLRSLGVTLPRENRAVLHTKLTQILGDTADAEMNEIGQYLADLRDQRNAADYDLQETEPDAENFARLRLADAEHVISFINTYKVSTLPARVAAKESIRSKANKLLWGTEAGL